MRRFRVRVLVQPHGTGIQPRGRNSMWPDQSRYPSSRKVARNGLWISITRETAALTQGWMPLFKHHLRVFPPCRRVHRIILSHKILTYIASEAALSGLFFLPRFILVCLFGNNANEPKYQGSIRNHTRVKVVWNVDEKNMSCNKPGVASNFLASSTQIEISPASTKERRI